MRNNQSRPFFSVIIPTLNEEKYLPKLLDDLTRQTFDNFEVIVVDGKSGDSTRSAAFTYRRFFRWFSFLSTQRRNASYQRNLGVKKARGEYLFFIDADMRLTHTSLEQIYAVLQRLRSPIATTWLRSDDGVILYDVIIWFVNYWALFVNKLGKPIAGACDLIVSKAVFRSLGGFRNGMTINDDVEFLQRVSKRKIRLHIFKTPRLTYSMRRFKNQGAWSVVAMYTFAYFYSLFHNPVVPSRIRYKMGGHVHG